MTEVVRKKLNLLIHLAKIDGQFDESEKKVLESLLAEAGMSSDLPKESDSFDINQLKGAPDRADILYWSLRIIKADGIIHPDESAYCKALALKLNYKPDLIDYYEKNELGDRATFKKRIMSFTLASA